MLGWTDEGGLDMFLALYGGVSSAPPSEILGRGVEGTGLVNLDLDSQTFSS